MTRITGAAALVLALLAAPAWAQTNTAIVAGQHVAGVRLGAGVNDAVATFGNLYNQADSRSGKYTLYEWPLRPFVAVAEKESGKVVLLVVVLSDAYRTDRGITGGTERAAVEAAYGREFTTDEDNSSTTMIYDGLGIAFDIGKVGVMTGRVIQIIVFTPGQWKAITEGL